MARRNSLYPRPIEPELIESGDTIEVEYREIDGIISTKRGTVAYIAPHGHARHFVTQYGATIAQYSVARKSDNFGKKFILIDRAPIATPMLDMFTESGRL